MALLTSWPNITDDLGDRQSGTVWNANLHTACKEAIEDVVHSTSNPLPTPADIIDEVVDARGSKPTLDGRLDVSLNEDGTLKTQASLVQTTDLASVVGHGNWVYNDDFLIWPAGDSAAPSGWALSGSGASVARCGNGLSDTNTKVGPFCVKLTRASVDADLRLGLVNVTSFSANGAYLKGRKFGFGCWVKCSIAYAAKLILWDGVSSTEPVHTGDGTWQWLSGVHTLSASATELTVVLRMSGSSGDAYYSGATAIPGNVAPGAWVPCPKVYGAIVSKRAGILSTGTDLDRFLPARPLLVKDVQLLVLGGGSPTTQPIIVDVNVWDGAAFQSMFSTKPQIAASATSGHASPDGTYRYRCATAGRSSHTNALLNVDIDQVGSGTAGSDLTIIIRALQYARPQESLLDVADF